jgi:hypothetical protein
VGGIFPYHASGRRHPYMLVEPKYRLGLGMALVLYVPIQQDPFHHVDNVAVYQKWASEVISFVPFLFGPPVIYTASLEVARQIVAGGYQSVWAKPKWATKDLEYGVPFMFLGGLIHLHLQ